MTQCSLTIVLSGQDWVERGLGVFVSGWKCSSVVHVATRRLRISKQNVFWTGSRRHSARSRLWRPSLFTGVRESVYFDGSTTVIYSKPLGSFRDASASTSATSATLRHTPRRALVKRGMPLGSRRDMPGQLRRPSQCLLLPFQNSPSHRPQSSWSCSAS